MPADERTPGEQQHAVRADSLIFIAAWVLAIWGVAVLVQVIFPAHVVPTEVHGIVFVVVTGLFGSAAWSAKKSNGVPKSE